MTTSECEGTTRIPTLLKRTAAERRTNASKYPAYQRRKRV